MNKRGLPLLRERFKAIGTVLVLLTLSLGQVGSAFSQEVTGNLSGEIKDPTGALIAGAVVTAASDRQTYDTTTDSAGVYTFRQLPPGRYTITASGTGFGSVRRENVVVEIGRTLQVNFDLTPVATGDTVTVTASDQPIVDVTSSKTATNINEQQIESLPKRTLNFTSVLEVAPGTRNEGKAAGFQVDGASGSENVFVIDGVEVTNIVGGTLGGRTSQTAKNIPLDFVKEVQVKSAGYEAEYGGATGGVFTVVTKGGTNDWHGEIRLEYSSDTFRAEDNPDLLVNRLDQDAATTEYRFNPSGKDNSRFVSPIFSLGGPILKDKLWFFASYAPQYFNRTRRLDLIKAIAPGDTQIVTLNSRDVNYREKDNYYIGRLDWAPTSNVSIFGNFINSSIKTEGPPSLLALQTTSNITFGNPRYAFQGGYTPAWQGAGGVVWNITDRLLFSFRGGHTYLNDKGGSYDIPLNTPLVTITVACPSALFNCPPGTTTTGNPTILTNSTTLFDITRRTNLNFDATYIARVFGQQHILKGGYQTNRLSNKVQFGNSGGRFNFSFDRARSGQRGQFGFYQIDEFERIGDVSSSNQGLFVQDSWQVHPRFTANLGLRFEKEFLPSFPVVAEFHPTIPEGTEIFSDPIKFGWGDKIAPRLGFAFDVFGNGKLKISGSYSRFFDTMKYELARGSFGGEKFLRTFRKLDTLDIFSINLNNTPGDIISGPSDLRFPSNTQLPGEQPGVDPNIEPYRQHEYSLGAEYAFGRDIVVSARFTRKELDRAIEDIGGALPDGTEIFTIGNPGFGITQEVFDPPTPRAVREYTGLELRLDKRFTNNWYANVSYIRSKLFGNYSGLASSDEFGRTSPNVNRYFDLPEESFNTFGEVNYGRLPTDRPNTFKFFSAYRFDYGLFGKRMETEIGGSQIVYQGIPLSTRINVGIGGSVGLDVYPVGRGDIGRTNVLTQTDLILRQAIPINERVRFNFTMNVSNLFDERNELDRFNLFTGPGQTLNYASVEEYLSSNGDFKERAAATAGFKTDPRYNLANSFQAPREVRFAFGITF